MLRRNRLKTITVYNFSGKKVTRSFVSYVNLIGSELVLDLHYAIHEKGKKFVMPEDFEPENKATDYTVAVGDIVVEGKCEETKKAKIIEAGGFIVKSVEVACESFGMPVIMKVALEPMSGSDNGEDKDEDKEEDEDKEDEEPGKTTEEEDKEVKSPEGTSEEDAQTTEET